MLGRISPRSGLGLHHINVGGGVVDEDFHGNLSMILFKHSDNPFHIHRGDRVAQIICQKIFYPDLGEVKELNENERGNNGFGSTGRN